MTRLKYLLRKEFKQFWRHPFLKRMTIMYPILVMFLMPFATNLDLTNCAVSIVDHSQTELSSRLTRKIEALPFFNVTGHYATYKQAIKDIEEGNATVVVEIPRTFDKDWVTKQAQIYLSANAVDGMTGNLALQYLQQVVLEFAATEISDAGIQNTSNEKATGMMPRVSVQYLFNETLDYKHFMIPGLMVFVLLILTGLLPALNIVQEKEIGTIEQINVTPIDKWQFILSKLIPYWVLGLTALSICFILCFLVYSYTPVGSYWALYAIAVLFIMTMSAIGIIISNISTTMQQAQFVMFFLFMIFILMSGLFTPVESMPDWAQWIAAFIPPKYFVDGMRAIFLKGSTLIDIRVVCEALLGFALIFGLFAVQTYHKQS